MVLFAAGSAGRHARGTPPSLAAGQWTWASGSNTVAAGVQYGVYGTKGVADPANRPGMRRSGVSWTASSGDLWTFGGNANNGGWRNDLWKYSTATGMWTWMAGSDLPTQYGTYGTLGTPALENTPGAREEPVTWVDAGGHLWLFGGFGYSGDPLSYGNGIGYLNDLWRYSIASGEWTWMGGSNGSSQYGTYGVLGTPAPGNVPGGRQGAVSWWDASGNLWLFGGYGLSLNTSGKLNDLWRYSIASGQWTWMAGSNLPNRGGSYGTLGTPAPGNVPGARRGAVSFVDPTGNLWLFGGNGNAGNTSGYLNDLWTYSMASGQWTWMSGSNAAFQYGTYGEIGTPAPGNVPGARQYSVSWADGAGNLWLFGGEGQSAITNGRLNDLWRYSIPSGEWAWMGGSDTVNQYGTYGTLGTPAPGNRPGARASAVSFTDAGGNLWLFGGTGNATSWGGDLNDLWRYSIASGEWTWMSGSSVQYQFGVYGALGTPAPANVPGARKYSVSWTGSDGNLWLFGGQGYAASSDGFMNDLWSYSLASGQWTWMRGSNEVDQFGTYGALGTPAPENVPGARLGSVSWSDADGNLWLFGGCCNAASSYGRLNDLWRYSIVSGEWTWMSGSNVANQFATYGTLGTPAPGNAPGGRQMSASWADASGNLWLFGGYGYAASNYGSLNDLWRYSIASGQWTWMGGSNAPNQSGTYGTLGTPTPGNTPGAREGSVSWADTSGNLWLFGGHGYAASSGGELNDLWRYSIASGQWTWMGGSNAPNQSGTYGTIGAPAPGNTPGARKYAVSFTYGSETLWLFGGEGYTASSGGKLNDLWRYSITSGQWTWMGGSNAVNQYGAYGAIGTPAPGNVPGAREYSLSWIDAGGNLWLFGGEGFATSLSGALNDLWGFSICAAPAPPSAIPAARCGSGTVTISAAGAGAGQDYKWYDAARGGTLLQNGGAAHSTPPISATTIYYASIYDTTTNCESRRTAVVATIAPVPPAPTAGNNGPLCVGATLNLTCAVEPDATYSWTGPNSFVSATQNPVLSNVTAAEAGTYSVTVTVGSCTSPAGTTDVLVNTDAAAPVVTAPGALTVEQSLCCGAFGGASGGASTPLSGFLSGGSATDDCDTNPTRLPPQVSGVDATTSTCFEAGTTTVTFRFQDAAGHIGSAISSVTVSMVADLNLDSAIDPSDMVVLRAYFNFVLSPGTPPFGAALGMADLNHDAAVDPTDMVILRAYLNFVVGCLAP